MLHATLPSLTPNQTGDILLIIPTTAFRTLLTAPTSISKAIGPITVHGLLAANLALDASEFYAPWRTVLPTSEDIKESMPLLWPPQLQALLPVASASLLFNQQRKLSADWTAVSAAFPTLSYETYVYNWLLVNTRTFYFTSPKIKLKKPINRDDCLALSPFADYFNHADVSSASASFSSRGYTITASQSIKKGEEVYISYGNHSNDFLLAEYGFVLQHNKWDEIALDEFLWPLFNEKQKRRLEETGFWGKYVLDAEGLCYRTQVALRILCMPVTQWQRLVDTELEDDDNHQGAVDEILLGMLKKYLEGAEGKLKTLKELECGLPSQKETLSRRWNQIRLLLSTAVNRIES